MGNSGSYTAKATISPSLFVFTKWGAQEIREFLHRGQQELPETFALRKHEFEFLLGHEMVDFNTSRALFNDIFDLDRNSLVDKFEVMCVVCLTSQVDNIEKIHFFFDLFNFNNKGYLFQSELTLLMLAVSKGVFKADQKYLPPNNKTIALLVQEAFLHAKVDRNSIRKPELVNFALANAEILAFLESWRGHASQVLLPPGDKWKDLTFPCSETSIIPSSDWTKLGFPPGNFVKWRRRQKAGSDLGYLEIFTHELSFLKTVDRRVVYTGEGVIGRGSLWQGMLADRWFLNALAAMTSRPDTILACLASTGQEALGRFCTRFYEGSGWRSVNVDDRVPCSPDGHPLFATSSHSLEAWSMLLEKGLAKYLGSYGHVGRCGGRGDATEAGLRLLTGGHVYKHHVKDFDWRSVEDDVVGQSGAAFVKKCLAEGTIISFGKSESIALMQYKPAKPPATSSGTAVPTPPVIQPFGRLFPVVGTVLIRGYNHLILRDAYDLIADCDINVNYESGHSRTFKLKIEDMPLIYDTIIISRFPDSLRVNAEKLRLRPWRTEVLSQATRSPESPAKFLLTVSKSLSNGVRLNPIRKLGDMAANITAVLNESEGKVRSELEKVMTLKEKVDFSRVKLDKESYVAASQSGKGGDGKKAAEAGMKKPARRASISKRSNEDDVYELVDCALTISSSCDWTFAGSEDAGPKLRVRITPTPATLERLRERDRQIEAMRKQIRELAEARRQAAIKLELELAALANSTGDDGTNTLSGDSATADHTAALFSADGQDARSASHADLNRDQGSVKTSRSEKTAAEDSTVPTVVDEKIKYDVILGVERSWVSSSLKLYPGEYFVFADATYSVPYEEAFKMTVPAHLSEAPWLDSKSPSNYLNNVVKSETGKSFTRRASSATMVNVNPAKSKLVIPSGLALSDNTAASASSSGVLGHDNAPDLSKMPLIWLQVSSLEHFEVKAIARADLPMGFNGSVAEVEVQPERWPFASESQADVSSRALQNMLTKARMDAQLVGLQFMNLANHYREERKKALLAAAQAAEEAAALAAVQAAQAAAKAAQAAAAEANTINAMR